MESLIIYEIPNFFIGRKRTTIKVTIDKSCNKYYKVFVYDLGDLENNYHFTIYKSFLEIVHIDLFDYIYQLCENAYLDA